MIRSPDGRGRARKRGAERDRGRLDACGADARVRYLGRKSAPKLALREVRDRETG